jgi:hypothetical protein
MSLGQLRRLIHGAVNFTVPPSRHVDLLYGVWSNMHRRCSNPNDKAYPNYGGRGIKVCARWQSFENFADDMAPRPPGMSIDRIDVNGDYEPSNCRWATFKEQIRNRRVSRYVTIDGQTHYVADLAAKFGLDMRTVYWRASQGWPMGRIVSGDRQYNNSSSQPKAVRANAEKKKSQTQCKRGHELAGSNLYLHGDRRHCKTCRSLREKNHAL